MKERKKDIARIKNLIEQDYMNTDDKFNEILVSDLCRVMGDYFDVRKEPTVEISKKNNQIEVVIKFVANAIKNFKFIVKQ